LRYGYFNWHTSCCQGVSAASVRQPGLDRSTCEDTMSAESENHDESLASAPDDLGADLESPAHRRKQLAALICALIFIFSAGCIALYRYMQHMTIETSAKSSVSVPKRDNELFQLKPFRIALAGPGTPSYAQVEVVINHRKDPELIKELRKRESQIREIILFIIQTKTKDFLLLDKGKEVIRNEILVSINRVMRRNVDEIHISELSVI